MADETIELQRELKEASKALTTATDEVKKIAEKTETEIKNLGKETGETKEAADKALLAMNTLGERMTGIEQKLARGGDDERERGDYSTPGERFLAAEEVKSRLGEDNFKGHLKIEVKTITSASTSGASASTGLVIADRQGFVAPPERPLMVRDLLMPGRTSSGFIEYAKETAFTNNAATVAENPGSAKPESNITYSLVNTGVKTIAHWIPASKQILADAPQLQSMIDGRLRYGLAYAEDLQLLLGDGTGTNLLGLMPQASAYSAATTGITEATGVTKIDRLRLAMLQATLALYPSTGTVLNPADWAAIELTKDANGRYVFANPTGRAGPVLWGLPVVESLAMTQNLFLTGAFKMAAQVFDREDANVLISTEDRDNFVKNMVTLLAEERLALAVYRAAALIKGNFTGAA